MLSYCILKSCACTGGHSCQQPASRLQGESRVDLQASASTMWCACFCCLSFGPCTGWRLSARWLRKEPSLQVLLHANKCTWPLRVMDETNISTSKRPLGASRPTDSNEATASPVAAPCAVCCARASWNTYNTQRP